MSCPSDRSTEPRRSPGVVPATFLAASAGRCPDLEGHRPPRRDPHRRAVEDEPCVALSVAERYVPGDDDLAGRLVGLRSGRRNTHVRSLHLAGRLADRQLDQLDQPFSRPLLAGSPRARRGNEAARHHEEPRRRLGDRGNAGRVVAAHRGDGAPSGSTKLSAPCA